MSEPISEKEISELSDLLSEGRKVDAIRRYRALAGVDLYEAKKEVDRLEKELRERFPDRFPAIRKPHGCLGSVVVIFALVLVALHTYYRA